MVLAKECIRADFRTRYGCCEGELDLVPFWVAGGSSVTGNVQIGLPVGGPGDDRREGVAVRDAGNIVVGNGKVVKTDDPRNSWKLARHIHQQ